MRSPARAKHSPSKPHSDTQPSTQQYSHNSNQHHVSFELDIPVTLAQALEDDATKAGLSLDDFLCKVLSEQLKRYDEQ